MTQRFLRLLPMLASFFMATAMFVQLKAWAVSDDASAYHEAIRSAVRAIPTRFNGWEGTDIRVPAPAARLLRPNGDPFARYYENARSGRSASVVLVHCTDARDMSGHYPPNCYPASGWTMQDHRREVRVALGSQTVPVAIYAFQRTELGSTRHLVVYNFFVLPRGIVTGMNEVQAAGGEHRLRPLGAAQVQVIMDAGMPEPVRQQTVEELLQPLAPVINKLQAQRQGDRP